jgi:hypothetical protein
MEEVRLEKLIVAQLVKKFFAFYGSRGPISVFTTNSSPLALALSQYFKIQLNINHPIHL